jgi:hypothetical protein
VATGPNWIVPSPLAPATTQISLILVLRALIDRLSPWLSSFHCVGPPAIRFHGVAPEQAMLNWVSDAMPVRNTAWSYDRSHQLPSWCVPGT